VHSKEYQAEKTRNGWDGAHVANVFRSGCAFLLALALSDERPA
jgi:hypothetical protein